MTSPDFMVIGSYTGGGGGGIPPPPAVLDSKKPGLFRVKTTIQPFFATRQFTEFEPTQVTKGKLLKLWFENKKKVIEIIKYDSVLTCKQPVVIDKERIELYFDQKYDKPRTNLSAIFDVMILKSLILNQKKQVLS